jgi:hypothetical protein
MNDLNGLLKQLAESLQKEADTKVTKAMRLWCRCDDTYKWLVLRLSGFNFNTVDPQNLAKQLREHFDTMDLMDELDSCIDDMEFEIDGYDK